jgi:pimeloyl-ACP methyl ester carboxylesterase
VTTLVLIPGLAANARMWQAQLQALEDLQPVVTDVHMRHERIEEMAAALLEDHPGPLALCGASMGGMIAMEAARQTPQRVRALALLGTTARPETEDMRALREAAIVLYQQGRVAEVLEPNVRFAFHPDQASDPAIVQAYLALLLEAGGDQLARQNRAVISRPDATLHLPRLRGEVLVMCGDSDQLTPPECSREIAALVPGARLEIVPRCGHMLTMEKPEAVNAALRGWLARAGV